MRKLCQNLNRDNITYLIKYTLTVQFLINTSQLHNNNLLNMKGINSQFYNGGLETSA